MWAIFLCTYMLSHTRTHAHTHARMHSHTHYTHAHTHTFCIHCGEVGDRVTNSYSLRKRVSLAFHQWNFRPLFKTRYTTPASPLLAIALITTVYAVDSSTHTNQQAFQAVYSGFVNIGTILVYTSIKWSICSYMHFKKPVCCLHWAVFKYSPVLLLFTLLGCTQAGPINMLITSGSIPAHLWSGSKRVVYFPW